MKKQSCESNESQFAHRCVKIINAPSTKKKYFHNLYRGADNQKILKKMFENTAQYCKKLQITAIYYNLLQILQNITKFCKILQYIAKIQQIIAQYCKILQSITKFQEILQNIFSSNYMFLAYQAYH
jgi:hypothetical protein